MSYDSKLMAGILNIFVRTVFGELRRLRKTPENRPPRFTAGNRKR